MNRLINPNVVGLGQDCPNPPHSSLRMILTYAKGRLMKTCAAAVVVSAPYCYCIAQVPSHILWAMLASPRHQVIG